MEESTSPRADHTASGYPGWTRCSASGCSESSVPSADHNFWSIPDKSGSNWKREPGLKFSKISQEIPVSRSQRCWNELDAQTWASRFGGSWDEFSESQKEVPCRLAAEKQGWSGSGPHCRPGWSPQLMKHIWIKTTIPVQRFEIHQGRLDLAFWPETHQWKQVLFSMGLWVICHSQLYNFCNYLDKDYRTSSFLHSSPILPPASSPPLPPTLIPINSPWLLPQKFWYLKTRLPVRS